VLGAGIEPARAEAQGILSRRPPPRIPRFHSNRHRREPRLPAPLRTKSDTTSDTGEDDPDGENPLPAPSLGNTTKKQSGPYKSSVRGSNQNDRRTRRKARYDLRDVLHEVSSLPRVAACGRFRVSGGEGPEIRMTGEEGDRVAHFAKVQLCGRVWVCPVCGPRIRQLRAEDLDQACIRWIMRYGPGSIMLLTLTLPHDFSQALSDLLRTVRDAFSLLASGRAWQEDKVLYGLAHHVKAHDVTVGPNGWHPHLHLVLFGLRVLTAADVASLSSHLFERWAEAIVKHGGRRPGSRHGVSLEQARSRNDVSRYVCQVVAGDGDRPIPVALEVARGDLKASHNAGHRTPWQILADFKTDGDCKGLALWLEWEKATRGVHAIRWSKGLRADVGMADELTDEDIVAIEVGGDVVYTFSRLEWRLLVSRRGAMALILEAAEKGGADAVRGLLARLEQPNLAAKRVLRPTVELARPGDIDDEVVREAAEAK
jgi:hypothetical protein